MLVALISGAHFLIIHVTRILGASRMDRFGDYFKRYQDLGNNQAKGPNLDALGHHYANAWLPYEECACSASWHSACDAIASVPLHLHKQKPFVVQASCSSAKHSKSTSKLHFMHSAANKIACA
jgi:hypothetical protein